MSIIILYNSYDREYNSLNINYNIINYNSYNCLYFLFQGILFGLLTVFYFFHTTHIQKGHHFYIKNSILLLKVQSCKYHLKCRIHIYTLSTNFTIYDIDNLIFFSSLTIIYIYYQYYPNSNFPHIIYNFRFYQF